MNVIINRKGREMKKIMIFAIIAIFFSGCMALYGQNDVTGDTTTAVIQDSSVVVQPEVFNDYLGIATDTTTALYLINAINKDFGNYAKPVILTKIQKQDQWKYSKGSVVIEYYYRTSDSTAMKIAPADVLVEIRR
jgi:PBP1b-binding outer membrane lipoprotein LpoB